MIFKYKTIISILALFTASVIISTHIEDAGKECLPDWGNPKKEKKWSQWHKESEMDDLQIYLDACATSGAAVLSLLLLEYTHTHARTHITL